MHIDKALLVEVSPFRQRDRTEADNGPTGYSISRDNVAVSDAPPAVPPDQLTMTVIA